MNKRRSNEARGEEHPRCPDGFLRVIERNGLVWFVERNYYAESVAVGEWPAECAVLQ